MKIDPGQNRDIALDQLRGMAILMMVLSGMGPYGVMPAWMYHAQKPPPDHMFNPHLPGFTWVDLVFPMFLFALGVAIPLSLSKKSQAGETRIKIYSKIIKRGLLLGSFAIFLQHVRPHQLNNDPAFKQWILALAGFILMFLMYVRFPDALSEKLKRSLRISGWTGAVIICFLAVYPDGDGFNLYRSDIILIVLTNMAVFGSLWWVRSKDNLVLRLSILPILMAFRLSSADPGWIQALWEYSPLPWIFKFQYLQYLLIVIPGTVIGDILLQTEHSAEANHKNRLRRPLTLFLLVFILVTCLTGLQARFVLTSFILSMICITFILWDLHRNSVHFSSGSGLILMWGIFWLCLGFIVEPFEGGIKKDPATISYYFITSGLSIFIFLIFTIMNEFGKYKRSLSVIVSNGMNPMVAYVGFANFVWPVLALTGLDNLIRHYTKTPWIGFLRSLSYTLLVALIVNFFTRLRLFWKT